MTKAQRREHKIGNQQRKLVNIAAYPNRVKAYLEHKAQCIKQGFTPPRRMRPFTTIQDGKYTQPVIAANARRLERSEMVESIMKSESKRTAAKPVKENNYDTAK